MIVETTTKLASGGVSLGITVAYIGLGLEVEQVLASGLVALKGVIRAPHENSV